MNETEALRLTDLVRQTAFEAHTFLRHGHNEKVYENSLRNRLRKNGLTVEQQVPIKVYDEDGSELGEFFADLFVNNELIVELKAVRTWPMNTPPKFSVISAQVAKNMAC